jgi:hypothetical protein
MTKQFGLIYLAALLIIVLVLLLFGHPDDAIKTLLIGAATALLSKIQTVYDFFFGSSQGSKDKDAALAAQSPKPGDPQ